MENENIHTLFLSFFLSFSFSSKAKHRDEDESKPQQDKEVERQGLLPWDSALCSLIAEATKSILPLQEEREQHKALAMYVYVMS